MKIFENHLPVRPRKKWDNVQQYIEYLRHFMAYKYARKFVKGKCVLEIGCGTGYGTHYTSKFASNVIAMDISRLCIVYCRNEYKKGKLNFLRASGLSVPLRDSSIDVALSFQVIEHIEPEKVEDYLLEIRRVLTNEGFFVVSTPNKKLRLLPFQKPRNPEHKREYEYKEFKNLLINVFENVKVYGLKGSEKIQSITRNGLKQNPFEVYALFAKKILPPSIASQFKIRARIKKMGKSIRDQRKEQRPFSSKITKKIRISDFKVLPYCPGDCLDFFGVCRKMSNVHEEYLSGYRT